MFQREEEHNSLPKQPKKPAHVYTHFHILKCTLPTPSQLAPWNVMPHVPLPLPHMKFFFTQTLISTLYHILATADFTKIAQGCCCRCPLPQPSHTTQVKQQYMVILIAANPLGISQNWAPPHHAPTPLHLLPSTPSATLLHPDEMRPNLFPEKTCPHLKT